MPEGLSHAGRGVYCNRTLNLRSIKVIGYDMDYTLVDYHVEEWERCVYDRVRGRFAQRGILRIEKCDFVQRHERGRRAGGHERLSPQRAGDNHAC